MKVKLVSPHILKLTLPLHLMFFAGLFYYLTTPFPGFIYFLVTLVGWFLISGYGIAIGFHRLLSHRSFKTHPLIEKTLMFLGCLGAQGSPIFWMSVHQGAHHPFCDSEKDLHSPRRGLWQSYWGWQVFLEKSSVPFKTGFFISKDPYQKFLHAHYYKIIWLTLLAATAVDPIFCFYGLLTPMILSIHQENIVNTFGHLRKFGYRNFETPDDSVNNPVLGILFFGQGWHNNHHANPRVYDFGYRWYEIDPAKYMIDLIKTSTIDIQKKT